MLWCAVCRMMYVYAILSSLALSSQPVCAWVGWHRCLTVYTYAHIVQTIAPHLLSLLLLLYILYNIYTLQLYTYQIWYLFTLYCVMWRGYVIHQLLYILHYAILCIYMLIPLWYMTMYITSHTILIYYNNYYYDNSNSYLFLFFIFIIVLLCMCVRVCVVLCYLSCVCMCALLCVLAYVHTCVSVCVYPASPSWTVLWWRGWCVDIGGIFREKIFTKFGKWVYHVKTDRKSIFDLGKR